MYFHVYWDRGSLLWYTDACVLMYAPIFKVKGSKNVLFFTNLGGNLWKQNVIFLFLFSSFFFSLLCFCFVFARGVIQVIILLVLIKNSKHGTKNKERNRLRVSLGNKFVRFDQKTQNMGSLGDRTRRSSCSWAPLSSESIVYTKSTFKYGSAPGTYCSPPHKISDRPCASSNSNRHVK